MTQYDERFEQARGAVLAADAAWAAALDDADAKRAYKAAVKAFRAVEREAMEAGHTVDCGRCGGTGYLSWARHVLNGVCFRCGGAKKVALTKTRFEAAPDTRAKRQAKWQAERDAAKALLIERGAGEAIARIEAAEALCGSGEDGMTDGEAGVNAARAVTTLGWAISEVAEKVRKFGDAEKGMARRVRGLIEAADAIGVGATYRRMDARFRGECVVCGERIKKGERIAFDGDAAHDECAVERYDERGDLLSLFDLGAERRRAEAAEARAQAEYEASPDGILDRIEREAAERERAAMDAEYEAGVADAERYLAEKAIYGEALADAFAAEDEFNRYWKYGEDY